MDKSVEKYIRQRQEIHKMMQKCKILHNECEKLKCSKSKKLQTNNPTDALDLPTEGSEGIAVEGAGNLTENEKQLFSRCYTIEEDNSPKERTIQIAGSVDYTNLPESETNIFKKCCSIGVKQTPINSKRKHDETNTTNSGSETKKLKTNTYNSSDESGINIHKKCFDFESRKRVHNISCSKCEKTFTFCTCKVSCKLCGKCFTTLDSMHTHLLICKNKNKIKCLKCNKFFPKKRDMLRHSKLKNCRKITPYVCLWCGEIFNTIREHLHHLNIKHTDKLSVKSKLEKMFLESNKDYVGPYPWDLDTFTPEVRSEIYDIYTIWSSSIFKNVITDSYDICEKQSLVICPQLPLHVQLITKVEEIFSNTNRCFKVNVQPSYILQNRYDDSLMFFEHYQNFSLFDIDKPALIKNKSDITSFFEKLSYDVVEERFLENRPNTRMQSLIMVACHFDITYTSFPIGGTISIEKQEVRGSIVNIPSYNKDCIFRNISYGIYCSDNKLKYPYFYQRPHLRKNEYLTPSARKKINENCKTFQNQWYKTFGTLNVYTHDLHEIEKMFDISLNVYKKTNEDQIQQSFCHPVYISPSKKKDRHFVLNLTKSVKKKICHVNFCKRPSLFLSRFQCKNCRIIIRKKSNYEKHLKTQCSKYSKLRFQGKYQQLDCNVFDKLENIGIHVDMQDRLNFDFLVFDFETVQSQPTVGNQLKTSFLSEMIPFSYSLTSTKRKSPLHFQSFDQELLIKTFVHHCESLSQKIGQTLFDKFKYIFDILSVKISEIEACITSSKSMLDVLTKEDECFEIEEDEVNTNYRFDDIKDFVNNSNQYLSNSIVFTGNNRYYKFLIYHQKYDLKYLERIKEELETFCFSTPILGFNSSFFDLGCTRKWLFPKLGLTEKSCTVIKKGSRYMFIKTPTLRFQDVINYISAGTTLDSFVCSMTNTKKSDVYYSEQKGYLPYDYITNESVLSETELPPYDTFYSKIKCCNLLETGFENEDKLSPSEKHHKGLMRYKSLRKLWKEKGFKTLSEYLVLYNNKDVDLLKDALIVYQKKFYQIWGVSLFQFVTLPSLIRSQMKKVSYQQKAPICLFSQKMAWVYHAVHNNKSGGSSQVFNRYCKVNETKIGSEYVKRIKGFDATMLYSGCLSLDYPCSYPITYTKSNPSGIYFSIEKEKYYQMMFIFMEYLQIKYGLKIMNKLSQGYDTILYGFEFDGFISKNDNPDFFRHIDIITNTDNLYQHAVVEFLGCWWHSHDCNKGRRDIEGQIDRYYKWVFKYQFLMSKNIFVIYIWECEYIELLAVDDILQSVQSSFIKHPFYNKYKNKMITNDSILSAVKSGLFFGFVCVDIEIPKCTQDDRYEKWPPIYVVSDLTFDDWSSYMKDNYLNISQNNRKLLVQCLRAKKILLATPLLQYYLNKDFIVSNVYTAIEYIPMKPYLPIIKSCISMRREGDKIDNSVLQETGKTSGNTLYGSLDISKFKHKNIKYSSKISYIQRKINSSEFSSINEIYDGLYEISCNKRVININTLAHHSFFTLAWSKLIMLEFVYDFLYEYLKPNTFSFLQTDTDSVYAGFTSNDLVNIVKPEYLDRYKVMIGLDKSKVRCGDRGIKDKSVFLNRVCCDSCYTYDKREPFLFKIEKEGDLMVSLSSKRYTLIENNKTEKISYAGVRKTNFLNDTTATYEHFFKDPLDFNTSVIASNSGIKVHEKNKQVLAYTECRTFNSAFYIKRYVKNCGKETEPITRWFTPTLKHPENSIIVHPDHHLSLCKIINLKFENKCYKTVDCFIESFDYCTDFEMLYLKTFQFLKHAYANKKYDKEILFKYKNKILLYYGKNYYLTTGVQTYMELCFIHWTFVKGQNKINNILHSLI